MTSSASGFEIISKDGAELCYVIRADLAPDSTTFITPSAYKHQVGFVVYPAGGEVQRHAIGGVAGLQVGALPDEPHHRRRVPPPRGVVQRKGHGTELLRRGDRVLDGAPAAAASWCCCSPTRQRWCEWG